MAASSTEEAEPLRVNSERISPGTALSVTSGCGRHACCTSCAETLSLNCKMRVDSREKLVTQQEQCSVMHTSEARCGCCQQERVTTFQEPHTGSATIDLHSTSMINSYVHHTSFPHTVLITLTTHTPSIHHKTHLHTYQPKGLLMLVFLSCSSLSPYGTFLMMGSCLTVSGTDIGLRETRSVDHSCRMHKL